MGASTHDHTLFWCRLVQEGNRLHFLADRAGFNGTFSDDDALHLDQAFPLILKQLELMLTSGELSPPASALRHAISQWAYLRSRHPWQLRLRIHRCLSHSTLTNFTRASMKTLPVTISRAAKPCMSPVAVWQMLLTRLLEQHYGLTLNDTTRHAVQ